MATHFCVENRIIKDEETDLYVYGFEILIGYILNVITVLFLGWMFDALLYVCIFLLFFCPLRVFSGGFHANDYRKCYIISVIAISSILFAEKYVIFHWSSIIAFLVVTISAIYIFLKAPLEDENKPLDCAETIKYKKIARIIVSFEWFTVTLMLLFNSSHQITYYSLLAMFTMFLLMCVGSMRHREHTQI